MDNDSSKKKLMISQEEIEAGDREVYFHLTEKIDDLAIASYLYQIPVSYFNAVSIPELERYCPYCPN